MIGYRVGIARARLAQQHAETPDQVKRFEARMGNLADVRRRARATSKRWCILRTSPSSTIALADKLEEDGFDVWTPVEIGSRRMPRSKKRIEHLTPVMPSFVFACADEAADLFRLSADQLAKYPSFSVFHHHDRIPVIAESELRQLRAYEQTSADRRARPRSRLRADPLPAGSSVQMRGAFEGLSGTVDESDGRFTFIVCGTMRIKMETSILRENVLQAA